MVTDVYKSLYKKGQGERETGVPSGHDDEWGSGLKIILLFDEIFALRHAIGHKFRIG